MSTVVALFLLLLSVSFGQSNSCARVIFPPQTAGLSSTNSEVGFVFNVTSPSTQCWQIYGVRLRTKSLGMTGISLWKNTSALRQTGPVAVKNISESQVFLFQEPYRVTDGEVLVVSYTATQVGLVDVPGSPPFPIGSDPSAYVLVTGAFGSPGLYPSSRSLSRLYGIDPILCPCLSLSVK